MDQASEVAGRVELLGAEVDLVTCDDVLALIRRVAKNGGKAVVANQNLHSLYLSRRSPQMAAFYARADLVEIDSMPLVLWGRLMGLATTRANRCTYLDWRGCFWNEAAARRWRVFCLGSEPGVASEAARRLSEEWPGVRIETHHGYFDAAPGSPENQAVLRQINAFQPHVILVGMGMPRQEVWIGQNLDAIQTGVALSVGAAFDYEAGVQTAAPRIYGQLCLEWLYRLAHDPRRLFRRYMIEPWTLIGPAVADLRRYVLDRSPAADAPAPLRAPRPELRISVENLPGAAQVTEGHGEKAIERQRSPRHEPEPGHRRQLHARFQPRHGNLQSGASSR